MFGLKKKKKEQKPLMIKAGDVLRIIKQDYDDGLAFCLIEFTLDGQTHTMGSANRDPDGDLTARDNIFFQLDGSCYDTFGEFAGQAAIGGIRLADSDAVLTVTRAGIVNGEALLRTPWGDTRLEKYALNQ